MRPLCIFHSNGHGNHCDDGFAAACVVNLALAGEVDLYPGQYGKEPPDVAGRDVIMVDFSYKRAVLDRMASECSTMVILDHHKTAAEDFDGFPGPMLLGSPATFDYSPQAMLDYKRMNNAPIAVHTLFDMERSGAGIAWDFFNHGSGRPRPRFIDYIEDRDLWRRKLACSDEFVAALRSHPQEVSLWTKFILRASCTDDLIAEGPGILRYKNKCCNELKQEARAGSFIVNSFERQPGLFVNAPYAFASEVAGDLAEACNGVGACYFARADSLTQYSLRSRDGGPDVSEIAKRFGGGGHRNAAGFQWAGLAHEWA